MLKQIAKMQRDGMTREQIAVVLKVSVEWLDKVMGADGFSSVKAGVGNGGQTNGGASERDSD